MNFTLLATLCIASVFHQYIPPVVLTLRLLLYHAASDVRPESMVEVRSVAKWPVPWGALCPVPITAKAGESGPSPGS
jgi:hypothetical protein